MYVNEAPKPAKAPKEKGQGGERRHKDDHAICDSNIKWKPALEEFHDDSSSHDYK